jgi:hypothetical protein
MVVPDTWVVLEGFGKISALSFGEIVSSEFSFGRKVRQIVLSYIADVGIVRFGVLESFGLAELYLLVLAIKIGVATL